MSKISALPHIGSTPATVLHDLLEDLDSIESLAVVVNRKDGGRYVSFSTQSIQELTLAIQILTLAAQAEILDTTQEPT